MTRPTQSETALLEKWRQGLFSATNKPEIATPLIDFGYPLPKLKEGSALMEETDSIWKQNTIEGDEATEASSAFKEVFEPLLDQYKSEREKAKVIFRKDPVVLSRLMLSGKLPEPFAKCIVVIEKFYDELLAEPALFSPLAMVKITPTSASSMKQQIAEAQRLRRIWNTERSESENATEAKDIAMAKMDDWMDDFYAMAKLALADNPQYLEALGIVVKR